MAKKVFTEIPVEDIKFLDICTLKEITPKFDTDTDESDIYVQTSVDSLFDALKCTLEDAEDKCITKKQIREFITNVIDYEELSNEIIKVMFKYMIDNTEGSTAAILKAAKMSWDEANSIYRW